MTEKPYRLVTLINIGSPALSAAWLVRNPEQVYAAYMGSTRNNAQGAAWGFAEAQGAVDLATFSGDVEALLADVHPADRESVQALVVQRGIVIVGRGALPTTDRG